MRRFQPDEREMNEKLLRALQDLERQTHALLSARAQILRLQRDRPPAPPLRQGFGDLRAAARPATPPRAVERAKWAMADESNLPSAPLEAYPGYVAASLQAFRPATIGYIIEGNDLANIESFVQTVYAAQRLRKDFVPVFITSCARFDPYVANNSIFEYIPPAEDFMPDAVAYADWRRQRIEHLTRKWGIADFFTFDSEAATRQPARSDQKPAVVVYPDYGDGNPYIGMMYAGMRDDFEITFGNPDRAIELLASRPVIFHLHWEDAVTRNLRDDAAPAAMASFVVAIDQLKALGGSFVWTVHNLEPHEPGDRDLSLEFSRQLALRADRVHVHDDATAEAFRRRFDGDRDIVVIQHPSYRGSYPPKYDRSLARRSLPFEVTEDEQLFLCFGQVRRYKGIAALMNVAPEFAGVAKFVIAGRSGRHDPRQSPPETCISIDGHIDDAMVATLFSAADFVVLPFEEITASGSLLLALSFGVPVIAPAHAGVTSVVQDGREGFLYPAVADGAALSNAIQRALDAPGWQREAMTHAAAAAAAFRPSGAFAAAVRNLFEAELARQAGCSDTGSEDHEVPLAARERPKRPRRIR
jgi:glycosyltransferase involved in cell wall biosynthesis